MEDRRPPLRHNRKGQGRSNSDSKRRCGFSAGTLGQPLSSHSTRFRWCWWNPGCLARRIEVSVFPRWADFISRLEKVSNLEQSNYLWEQYSASCCEGVSFCEGGSPFQGWHGLVFGQYGNVRPSRPPFFNVSGSWSRSGTSSFCLSFESENSALAKGEI